MFLSVRAAECTLPSGPPCWENGVGGVAATAPLHPPRETEREMFRCEFGVAFNSPPVARARRRPSPVVPLSLPPSFLPSLLFCARHVRFCGVKGRLQRLAAASPFSVLRFVFCGVAGWHCFWCTRRRARPRRKRAVADGVDRGARWKKCGGRMRC